MTIFDLALAIGIVGGFTFGVTIGWGNFGVFGAIAGGFLGVCGGFVVGQLPWVLASIWFRGELKRAGIAELRERLRTEHYTSHLLIAELVSRDEPLEDFRDVVVAQLHSELTIVRRVGEENARLWFPDLVKSE